MNSIKPGMIFCFLLCLLTETLSAENILKNADFKLMGENNIPRRWKVEASDKNACKFAPGSVTLTCESGKKVCIYQEYLAVEKGKTMEFSARITGNGVFRIFVDWPNSKRNPVNTKWQDFTDNWRAINSYTHDYLELSFTYTTPAWENQAPRLVIEVKSGNITFSNLKSTVSAPPAGLGKKWEIAGASCFVREKDRTSVSLGFRNFNEPSAWLSDVNVKPETWYELSFDAKPGIKTTPRGGYRNYKVGVRFRQETEARYSSWRFLQGNDYIRQNYRFKTPAGSTSAEIHFSTTTNCFIKNLELKEYQPLPLENCTMRLTSPLYRNSIYHSYPVKTISGTVNDIDRSIGSGIVELSLNGKKIQSVALKNQSDDTFEFSFNAENLADGDYLLSVILSDRNRTKQKILTDTIRKLPPAPMEVVIGEDNRIYINGKIFVPIACNGLVRNAGDKEKNYAAAHGMNLIVNVPIKKEKEMLELLDDLHKYGFKVILMSYFSITDKGFEDWESYLKQCLTPRVLQHPALVGFNLVDEPYESGYPPEILERCYKALTKIAPYQLVWLNCGPPGTILDQRQFMKACDMTGVDIYPVGGPWHSSFKDKSQTCVEKYALWINNIAENRKAILMYLQGYSWGEDSESITVKNPRYPTLEDLRLMTYTSFFGNASGVLYYTLWGVTGTAFYDDVFRFLKELHATIPLLIQGKVLSDTEDNRKIRTRIVEHSGKQYMFVLNMSQETRKNASVAVTFPDGILTVIHEDRTLAVKNRQVHDDFTPYAVHIYAVSELPPPFTKLPEWKAPPGLSPWRMRQEKNLKERIGVPYEGKANWIWCGGESIHHPGSKAWLGKWINVRKPVKKAEILAVADDMATLYLDGFHVGKINSWTRMERIDITKDISKLGRHLLTAVAQDGRMLPCGFLAEIQIEYSDGTKEILVTDDSWLASDLDEDKVRFDPSRTEKWQKAFIVAPYGSGVWKKGVKMPAEKQ